MSYVDVSEILNQIERYDQENQFQHIVDFIEGLEKKYHTAEVKSELARAYNNIYWKNKISENLPYLKKSVDILLEIKDELAPEELNSWHYRIGYAYYFLQDLDKATYHLTQVEDINNSLDLLRQIDWIKRHNITAVEASLHHTSYLLQDFLDFTKNHFPELFQSFKQGVSQQECLDWAEKLGCRLPSPLIQFYMMINGQDKHQSFSKWIDVDIGHFVSLEEIAEQQQIWQDKLTRILGQNWQNLDSENDDVFPSREWVKPMLYNEKWLPFLVGEEQILCVDLDPIYAEDYGQVLCIVMNEEYKECAVYYQHSAIQDVIYILLESLKAIVAEREYAFNELDMPTVFS